MRSNAALSAQGHAWAGGVVEAQHFFEFLEVDCAIYINIFRYDAYTYVYIYTTFAKERPQKASELKARICLQRSSQSSRERCANVVGKHCSDQNSDRQKTAPKSEGGSPGNMYDNHCGKYGTP